MQERKKKKSIDEESLLVKAGEEDKDEDKDTEGHDG